MPERHMMPANGGGVHKGEPDGVLGTPGSDEEGQVHGRVGGGDGAGGAYPNPHSGKSPKGSGLLGIGRQSDEAYYGGSNPNASAGGGILSNTQDDRRIESAPTRAPHTIETEKQSFDVVEDSGVAAAEATGKVGIDEQ